MLKNILSHFDRGEADRRSALEPEKPATKRTKNPDLKTWMAEAGENGEQSDLATEVLVKDIAKEQPKPSIVEGLSDISEKHGNLHLVIKEDQVSQEPEHNVENNIVDLENKLKDALDRMNGIQQELGDVRTQIEEILHGLAVERAKNRVKQVA